MLKTPLSQRVLLQASIHHKFPQTSIDRVADFYEDEPFDILGPHILYQERCIVINAFLPWAKEAWVKRTGAKTRKKAMNTVGRDGFYQVVFYDEVEMFSYQIGTRDASGHVAEFDDPYAFGHEISDDDLYLIGEGNHFKSYEKFGARLITFNGVAGVHFAVWAPNAQSVSVIGNFNYWDNKTHPMMRVHFSGVWGLFIPGLQEGEVYKYAIRSKVDNEIYDKSDPYAFGAELRPRTASVVTSLNHFEWDDEEWMKSRQQKDPLKEPMLVYEVHLGSWKRCGEEGGEFLDYRRLAKELVEYVKYMGYTHIEIMPVTEHPLDQSWGYQVVNYFAPTSRYGKPEDFKYFVEHCHQNGIAVLMDWVPAHFPKDQHGLANFDGRQIYAYDNWKKGEQKDWGTLVFDFGRNEVRNFLISNALFWLDKYHIDGLRVDAVASMIYLDYSRKEGEWEPNFLGGRENLEAVDFLKRFNEIIHGQYPGVLTIAEESTAWPGVSRPTYLGGLGFSMKWNMGWMNDTLTYFSKEPVHRRFHQDELTFALIYAFNENFVLPISHDEVVHGKGSLIDKMPGDEWQKFANLRLFYAMMYGFPGKKLLFMGSDFAQWSEWDAEGSLDWHLMQYDRHRQINSLVQSLNQVCRKYPAMYELDFDASGFEWIDISDRDASVLSFVRWSKDKKQCILFTCNMTPVPRENYRVGVPTEGFYEEILNTDAQVYGGGGIGNYGGRQSEPVEWHSRQQSICVNLPPLAVNVYLLKDR